MDDSPFTLFSRFRVVIMAYRFLFIVLMLTHAMAIAQTDTNSWIVPAAPSYAFIKPGDNTITNAAGLDSFFYKLQRLKNNHSGRVNIIHLGDSHIQADALTAVLRDGMQAYFGDAGRGMVFPYQVAGTNGPHDIISSSAANWKSNRLLFPDKPLITGISGYGLHSSSATATIYVGLKDMDGRQEYFNRMVFFLASDDASYKINDGGLLVPVTFYTTRYNDNGAVTVNTESMITGFQLSRTTAPANSDFAFYGVSLEKRDTPGVIYHSIGVNGARYDQFLQSDKLWSQLRELNGDLFIVSLGTNEAQNPSVNEEALRANCDAFVKMIRNIAPGAAIIITTPGGSFYRQKKPNKSLENVSAALSSYAAGAHIGCWDLYHICGGTAGIAAWKKYDLLSHDLVHYNNAGYQLQGSLLLNALAAAYNKYNHLHPFKLPRPVSKPETKPRVIQNEVQKPDYTPAKQAPAPLPVSPLHPKLLPVPPPEETIRPGSHIKVEYSEK